MTSPDDLHDRLTRQLLRLSHAAEASDPVVHPDDERIAMFCDGTLPEQERETLIAHLADCDPCRKLAAAVLRDDEVERPFQTLLPPTGAIAPVHRRWYSTWRAVVAVAAALLLALTGYQLLRDPGRMTEEVAYRDAREALLNGDFARTRGYVEAAQRRGLNSDRLRSLDAQATRRIASPVALARAGRLSDFGYSWDGVVSRDPAGLPGRDGLAEAQRILDSAGRDELEAVLNRGHLWLSLNEPSRAKEEFEAARQRAPDDPWVNLGLGLAEFIAEDFPAAEKSFRRVLELDAQNLAAEINLAMTLDELGDKLGALAAWQAAFQRAASAEDRQGIARQIQRLGGSVEEAR